MKEQEAAPHIMESINEQFHQIYNSSYNLPAYEAKPTTFTQKQLLEFSKAQHEYLTAIKPTTITTTITTTKQQPIVIFLVREITHDVLIRYQKVAANLEQTVFLITDKWWPRNKEGNLNIVFMFENFCHQAGYFYVNTDVMPDKLVITWDRCLFFLAQYQNLYENAWIIEDDVAIKGKDTLSRFFTKYSNSSADFLAGPPQVSGNNPTEWPLWASLRERSSGLTTLWASYNPVVRVSRRFIQEIQTFVNEKHRLFFLEIFFISLCIARGLKTEYFYDLEKHFRYTPSITFEETQGALEFPIFHPVKDTMLWDQIWRS